MGYTTEFNGQIDIVPPLNPQEIEYLNKLSNTRRMERKKGPYFVNGTGFMGQNHDEDVINSNSSGEQPGLWCQWEPNEDGTALVWNEAEKFYHSVEWMEYIIEHFLKPNPIAKEVEPENFEFLQGHTLNGTIEAQGEDPDDHWMLIVENNNVSSQEYPSSDDLAQKFMYNKSEQKTVIKKIEQAIQSEMELHVEYEDDEIVIYCNQNKNEKNKIFD